MVPFICGTGYLSIVFSGFCLVVAIHDDQLHPSQRVHRLTHIYNVMLWLPSGASSVVICAADSFPDYNLRKYVQQRVADLQSAPDATHAISKLQEMVRVWERQAVIYQRYARPQKGVMVRSCCATRGEGIAEKVHQYVNGGIDSQ